MSKIRFGFLVPTKTSVTSRENASKRKWMVYPKPTTGARPVQFQQPVPKRKWTGQVALVAWAVFHIVLSLSMVNMHTEIPSARRSASAQLSSDAVIANDRDSIWTLNYSRYFLLRESHLFGRP